MSDQKHSIWSDRNIDYDSYARELGIAADDDAIYSAVADDLYTQLCDERTNLNIQLENPIIVIADLGLWHGRVKGFKMIDSGNIADCIQTDNDFNEWYVDYNGDLRCTSVHHDGTNYYLYREIKPNISDMQLEHFQSKIYHGIATDRDLTKHTRRLGDHIGSVYGWDFPPEQEQKKKRELQQVR